MLSRSKKLLLNSSTSVIFQVVSVICGLIVPKIFIQYYGSEVNGLVQSITQFLNFITLLEAGVGAVVQSALYKPLAQKNNAEISKIIVSAERFFKKIAYIFAVYIAGLVVLYPIFVENDFGWGFNAVLILVISISTFAQYYFGITYQQLLNADQCAYIQFTIQIVTLLLNAIATVVMALIGADVIILKLTTSIIFLLRPLVFSTYAKKHYSLDKKIKFEGEPIKQKWNGLAQHLASVVLNSTDVVVLSLFSTLESVSVYYVYHSVENGVKMLLSTFADSIKATIGDMIAREEHDTLDKFFSSFEWLIHTLVTLLFTCTGILILPFIKVYTAEFTDGVNYYLPAFAVLITLGTACYCIRLPYSITVLAAGHYKQTQASAIIEAIINIVVSVVFVFKFGIVGVAIGKPVAMLYRTIYFVIYLKKNIMNRSTRHFVLHCIADIVTVLVSVLATSFIELGDINFISWIFMAVKVGLICLAVVVLVNLIFYFKEVKALIFKVLKRKKSA